MSKICQVTGKRPTTGHHVSHSNIKTKRRFLPNLQLKRLWNEKEERFVTLRLSNKALRLANKLGVAAVVKMARERGEKV